MSPSVKEFIEQNIQLIVEENWKQLLTKWYNTSTGDKADYVLYEELITTLEQGGIKIENRNSIEKDIIKDELILKINLKKDQNSTQVSGILLISLLKFKFEFSSSELFAIMEEVAEELNLTKDPKSFMRKYFL